MEFKNEVKSVFLGEINGVKFDREHIYYETLYLIEDENIFEDIDLTDEDSMKLVRCLKNYMEAKIYGKNYTMKDIVDELCYRDDLLSYIYKF